jgi:hypothetical protein
VKPPTLTRRHEPRRGVKRRVHREGVGQLEDERELKTSATAHELDTPEPVPETTMGPVIESSLKVAPPAPVAPTSASTEFGL